MRPRSLPVTASHRETDDALADLRAEELALTTGAVWAALNLDYPHHSFSHIGMFYGASLSLSHSSLSSR